MRFIALILLTGILFLLNIFIGAVDIPAGTVIDILMGNDAPQVDRFIIIQSRIPVAVTAILSGAGLAVSGLMLQTSFRNPLAGPSILGINSGASLGVAIVLLLLDGSVSAASTSISGYTAVIAGAFAGSAVILLLLITLSSVLKNTLMLLITGIMMGYITSSFITLLNLSSTAQGIQSYVMWGMSTFNSVSSALLPLFTILIAIGLIISLLLIKPLDILLLGDGYAINLGINLRLTRNLLLIATGLLSSTITAFCGPVAFIGLAVPHIARLIFRTDMHRMLVPATILTGACIALLCNVLCNSLSDTVIPLNAVTPLIGAPVVIWILLFNRKSQN